MAKKSSRWSLKVSLVLAALALLVSTIALVEFSSDSKSCINESENVLAKVSNQRVKELFYSLAQNPHWDQQSLADIQSLNQDELNLAYQTAVEIRQYPMAILLYQQGASNVFEKGQDILWVSISAGEFDLANQILEKKQTLYTYHLEAIRSMINLDVHNWVFIYKKEGPHSFGFQEYQKKGHVLANRLIAEYRAQHPFSPPSFSNSYSPIERYHALFGKNSNQNFEELVKKTLKEGYKFTRAKHGTQNTEILTTLNNVPIAVLKSKNEILAHNLDHDHFALVPPACKIEIPTRGEVVLQKWVSKSKMATDFTRSKDWDAEQLHHIRALDIRLGNSDRNSGNVLIKKEHANECIIPIDHDLIMHYIPNDLNWEAGYLNVAFSQQTQDYIQKIDLEKDAAIMRQLGYNSEEVQSMKLRTTLLKMCVEKKMVLREVDMLYRFFYYEFLGKLQLNDSNIQEKEIRDIIQPHFSSTYTLLKQPTEVWKRIGNNFEIYI